MPQYETTDPPDEVTTELARAILEDAAQHLELRLSAIARDFDTRLEQTRTYMMRRTRERLKELEPEQLELRRKKPQPVIPDWRVPGGEIPPDERKNAE